MPDGDEVHEKLACRYQKAYKMLCEGQAGSDIVAEVVQAVFKDVKQGGDKILEMLQKVAHQVEDILSKKKQGEEVDWRRETARLSLLDRHLDANSRLKALALEACKEVLQAVKYGEQPTNCMKTLLTQYLNTIATANFVERVPLTATPYNKVSQAFVREQLAMVRQPIEERSAQYAEAIYKSGTVHLARQPRRKNAKIVYTTDMDIPTTAIGA